VKVPGGGWGLWWGGGGGGGISVVTCEESPM